MALQRPVLIQGCVRTGSESEREGVSEPVHSAMGRPEKPLGLLWVPPSGCDFSLCALERQGFLRFAACASCSMLHAMA